MSEKKVFAVTQRVRYAETDAMGVVYHSNYLIWFEVGRVECLRAIGYPYSRLEAEGFGLPVVEVGCRYLRGAKFEQLVRIETWLDSLKSRKFRLGYRISDADTGEPLATGFTEHLCWRRGVVATIPVELYEKLTALL
ncbi:MAG: acyl-CoA thioesterase [Chloroflexi bacterium]|nr:acyl-CoA thioesterase [Chloroflexota bacterium]MBI3732341.1 acyl-CoA thioesterase [Chloroflexota bacterium]